MPTDGYDVALAGGGLALLAADTSLVVYPGGVPQPVPPAPPIPPPYVVVYSTVEWPFGNADALDGIAGTPTVRWICHSIGGGPGATPATADTAARAVGQRVRTALLNKRLVVAGLNLGVIRQETGGGVPQPDYQTGDPVMDLMTVYRTFAAT